MTQTLPTATGSFGDKPSLTFPAGEAPADLQLQILEQGSGAEVQAGQTIVVNYLGQVWNGEVFDNSYDRGTTISFPIGVGMVIAGWEKTLVGQQIGTRLLVSIPSDLGYGDQGVPQAGIRGGDTLVFVVDVVGVE